MLIKWKKLINESMIWTNLSLANTCQRSSVKSLHKTPDSVKKRGPIKKQATID